VVDDHVRHHLVIACQLGDVVPGAQPGVHLRVVDRIEACVGPVEGGEERQQVDAVERARERPPQQVGQACQVPA
jgi:hypothetical protein